MRKLDITCNILHSHSLYNWQEIPRGYGNTSYLATADWKSGTLTKCSEVLSRGKKPSKIKVDSLPLNHQGSPSKTQEEHLKRNNKKTKTAQLKNGPKLFW
ncbi:hypothetical protein CapIbe_017673 [Capra ibex]